MTGPEHYREAQRILELTGPDDHYRAYSLRTAQVHATLALTAATALAGVTLTLPQGSGLAAEWNRAIGITDEAAP